MRLPPLFVILLALMGFSRAQGGVHPDSVRFRGNHPGYAGTNIVFERVSNFILRQTSPVVSMQVDSTGNFDITFPFTCTTRVFANLGRTKAWVYIEPGKEYHLVLPPFEPLTLQEKLNPLFEPVELMIGIANRESQQLNRNIAEFDAMFDYELATNAIQIFTTSGRDRAMQIRARFDSLFTFNHPAFERHKELRYLELYLLARRQQNRQLVHEIFSREEIDLSLPAFWNSFTTLFTGFFPANYCPGTREKLTRSIARRERFDSIASVAALDTLFTRNPELNELVLLFSLHEAFHSGDLHPGTVMAITESGQKYASTIELREMAGQLHQRMAMLQPGTYAPGFRLIDQNGTPRDLKDFHGKFIYLNFIHTRDFTSVKHLQTLERIHREFRRHLQIVTVVIDEQFEDMERFLDGNRQFNWHFLHHGAYPRILRDYDIKSVPAFFLVNPGGKLVLSPAPAPDRGFREQFISVLNAHERENARPVPPAIRSIFGW